MVQKRKSACTADEALLGRSEDWWFCFLSRRTLCDVHLIKAQRAFIAESYKHISEAAEP